MGGGSGDLGNLTGLYVGNSFSIRIAGTSVDNEEHVQLHPSTCAHTQTRLRVPQQR